MKIHSEIDEEPFCLAQGCQLFVDVGHFDLLLGIGHAGIRFDLVAALEQLKLSDRQKLAIGGYLEAG